MNYKDAQDHVYWVETILTEAEEKLNDWERNFIENVKTRLMNSQSISDAQEAKLEEIYNRVTK